MQSMNFARTWRARWTIWQRVQDVAINQGEVLLSFDDGPHAETTPRLLDVLEQANVRGAFCICGQCIRAAPDPVRTIAMNGHLIVNHGDRHQPLALFSEKHLRTEIEHCDVAIANALGTSAFRTKFYRPACGLCTTTMKKVLVHLNKQVLPVTHFGWDTNVNRHTYQDWVAITQEAARRDQGGIFVLHDRRLHFWMEPDYDPSDQESSAYRGWVPDAASQLIDRLRSDGFTFLDPHVWSRRNASQPLNQDPLDPGEVSRQTDPE